MVREIFTAEAGPYRRTWVWATPFLAFGFLIVGQLMSILPADFLGLVTEENIEEYPQILFMLSGAFGMGAVLTVLWIKYFERRKLAGVGLAYNRKTLSRYGRGIGIGLAMGIFCVGGIWLAGGYEVDSFPDLQFGDFIPLILLLFGFIIQSGTEEFVFRGWLMSRVAARFGIWAGIIVNSVLFSLLHIDSATLALAPGLMVLGMSMTFLFAVFLSLYAIREGSIWGVCAWHAAWNWIFITWFGLPTTGIALGIKPLFVDLKITEGAPLWLTGGDFGPENSVITLGVLVVGILLVYRWKNKTPN